MFPPRSGVTGVAGLPSPTILIGVNIFLRSLQRQQGLLGFFRSNLAFAPMQMKETAYKTLVQLQLVYASPIWHPYHSTEIDTANREGAEDGCQVDLQEMEEHKQRGRYAQ